MFQRKIDELSEGLPSMFGVADGILIAGFNDIGRDHSATLDKVHRLTHLKLSKDKCLFTCTSIAFFSEIISQSDVSLDTGTKSIATVQMQKGIAVIPMYAQLAE